MALEVVLGQLAEGLGGAFLLMSRLRVFAPRSLAQDLLCLVSGIGQRPWRIGADGDSSLATVGPVSEDEGLAPTTGYPDAEAGQEIVPEVLLKAVGLKGAERSVSEMDPSHVEPSAQSNDLE